MSFNSYISKQFSNPAGIGGRLISYVMNRQNSPLYEATMRFITPSETDSVLDIGCGNGYVLNLLAQRYNCDLTGIDPSESILREASHRCRKFINAGRMTLHCQNVSAMLFPDATFSISYTINTVYFWEDLTKVMAEIRRVLKPNGLFVNTLYTDATLARFSHTQVGYKRFTAQQLTDAGKDVGFTVKVAPILGGSAYCVVYRKGS